MDETFYSRGAVLREGIQRFKRVLVVNEIANSTMLVDFEQEIVELVETSCTKRLILDDEVLKEYSTFNDFYGFFTSPQEHLLSVANLKPSGVTCEIILTIEHQWAVRKEKKEYGGRISFHPLPNKWIPLGEGQNTEENINAWYATPFPENIEISPRFARDVIKEEVTLWTSQNTSEQNFNVFKEIVERFVLMTAMSSDEAQKHIGQYLKEMHGGSSP